MPRERKALAKLKVINIIMVYREWVFITDDIKLLAKYILCGENLFKNQFYRAKRAANYNKDENKQY